MVINTSRQLDNEYFDGWCYARWDDNSTIDANGAFDCKLVFLSS